MYFKLINDDVGVTGKKIFSFFTSDKVFAFKSHLRIQVRKTSRNNRIKENKDLYLFSQCFGHTHSCIQIKSSDYCDEVYTKFKYLKWYNYILISYFLL